HPGTCRWRRTRFEARIHPIGPLGPDASELGSLILSWVNHGGNQTPFLQPPVSAIGISPRNVPSKHRSRSFRDEKWSTFEGSIFLVCRSGGEIDTRGNYTGTISRAPSSVTNSLALAGVLA